MSIHKKRREADRNKKLEEQFVKADTNSNGKIRPEQMIKIFEANEVSGKYFEEFCWNISLSTNLLFMKSEYISPKQI